MDRIPDPNTNHILDNAGARKLTRQASELAMVIAKKLSAMETMGWWRARKQRPALKLLLTEFNTVLERIDKLNGK